MKIDGSSCIVTGGAGFVGSHVVDALYANGAKKVTIVDNFSTGKHENILPRAFVEDGDLLDQAFLNRVFAHHDIVFHFAANADIRNNLIDDPRKNVEQNIIATQNVLEAMRVNYIKRIAFTSTGSVYGDAVIYPTPEDAPMMEQTSLYAASKVAAEGLLTAYKFGFGFETYIFRLVGLLGPRYSHGHVIDFWRKLKKNPLKIEILGDGCQRKDYLHVFDAVRGMLTAIEQERSGIYNTSSGECIDVRTSLRWICEELAVTPDVRFGTSNRGWIGDAPTIILDNERLSSLGWRPLITIENAIRATVRALESASVTDKETQRGGLGFVGLRGLTCRGLVEQHEAADEACDDGCEGERTGDEA